MSYKAKKHELASKAIEKAKGKIPSVKQAMRREDTDKHLSSEEREAFMKHHKVAYKKGGMDEAYVKHLYG